MLHNSIIYFGLGTFNFDFNDNEEELMNGITKGELFDSFKEPKFNNNNSDINNESRIINKNFIGMSILPINENEDIIVIYNLLFGNEKNNM